MTGYSQDSSYLSRLHGRGVVRRSRTATKQQAPPFEDGIVRLRRMEFCFDDREMERRWHAARSDVPKADRIAQAYSQITGRRIQVSSD